MPLTVTHSSGDGVVTNQVRFNLQLPDAGSTVQLAGQVIAAPTAPNHAVGTIVAMTGSPLTAPSPPGAGSIFWVIQVNLTTGAATIKQSTSAYPTADAGNVVIFQQTLISTSTNLALTASTTLDTN